jgi:hypothetical protein
MRRVVHKKDMILIPKSWLEHEWNINATNIAKKPRDYKHATSL